MVTSFEQFDHQIKDADLHTLNRSGICDRDTCEAVRADPVIAQLVFVCFDKPHFSVAKLACAPSMEQTVHGIVLYNVDGWLKKTGVHSSKL